MLHISPRSFAFLTLAFASCIAGSASIDEKDGISLEINGGNSSSITNHPYQVSVLYNSSFLCSGTVLNRKWVLTLASFVYGEKKKFLTIHAKSDTPSSGGEVYKVAKNIGHKLFKYDTLDYDFALLKIKNKFKFGNKLKAIRIAKESLPANTSAVISGWGGKIASQGTIQEATVITLEQENCQNIFNEYAVTSSMFCAQNPTAGPCWDDFGDPLIYEDKLYGQFSWTKGCSNLTYPGVYSNVPYVRDWILSTMKKQ